MKKIHIYTLIVFILTFGFSFLIFEKLNNNFLVPKNISESFYSTSSLPVKLKIPKIDVYADIEKVGVTKNGEMGVPKNLSSVGWYMYGVSPGASGSAVLDGHLIDNIRNKKLVFYRLDELKVGDDIYVLNTDGEDLHFKVVKKQVFDYDTNDTSMIFASSTIPKLNLITCNGDWIQNIKSYSKRLVVFTELVTE